MNALPLIFGITWLAVISPGADFAMISRNSFLHGRRAGMLAALGIAISCWFHVFYAVFGLTVMERLFPHLLNIVKIAGAAYLVYVGAATALARPAIRARGWPASASSTRPSGLFSSCWALRWPCSMPRMPWMGKRTAPLRKMSLLSPPRVDRATGNGLSSLLLRQSQNGPVCVHDMGGSPEQARAKLPGGQPMRLRKAVLKALAEP